MRPLLPFSLIPFLAAACSPSPKPAALPTSPPLPEASVCEPHLEDDGLFHEANIEGVFVVRDSQSGCIRATDGALADTGFLPHSTFKIPNSFIALESGVVASETHPFRWDGKKRFVHAWNQDQTFASALRVSCVWCFQEIAREVGEERMRAFVHDFKYGNEDIGGGVDQFWLTGNLRISPRQQVDFVRRSLDGEFPVDAKNVELVWSLLEIENNDESAWFGKTGLGSQDGRIVGWLVGYAQNGGRRFEYATFVRGGAEDDPEFNRVSAVRKPITRALLAKVGAVVR